MNALKRRRSQPRPPRPSRGASTSKSDPVSTKCPVKDDPELPVIEPASIPTRLRRLRWNELVREGDFVAHEQRGVEPWEGPSGFRADAFVKAVYRRAGRRSAKESTEDLGLKPEAKKADL